MKMNRIYIYNDGFFNLKDSSFLLFSVKGFVLKSDLYGSDVID